MGAIVEVMRRRVEKLASSTGGQECYLQLQLTKLMQTIVKRKLLPTLHSLMINPWTSSLPTMFIMQRLGFLQLTVTVTPFIYFLGVILEMFAVTIKYLG